jgi:hypothetical protein
MTFFLVPARARRRIALSTLVLATIASTESAATAAPTAPTKSAPRRPAKKARLSAKPEPMEEPTQPVTTTEDTKPLRDKEPVAADAASTKAKTAAPEQEQPQPPTEPQAGAAAEAKVEVKPAPETLTVGAPVDDEASLAFGKLQLHPYILLTGGLKGDFVKEKPNEVKDNRISTFALSRFGFKARWEDFVSVESEFMAAGGVGLHGTSAYEGQAALQVRQQVIRLTRWGFRLDAGRIIDEASVDFFSAHVGETFIQDTATRDALLFTGFNLGNGLSLVYKFPVVPIRVGFTFNAGNPVSNTASLLIGGTYPPFDRFYIQPYSQVKQSANSFPDDTFHEMVWSPNVMVDTQYFDFHAEVQRFDVDTNMNSDQDAHILGYNARGTMRVKLIDRMIVGFADAAYTRNDTLVPTNLAVRSRDRYVAVNFGGGFDVNVYRRFHCSYDCADGVGVQYQQVQFQLGDGLVTTNRYFNVGGTIWLAPNVSFGARFAFWNNEAEQPVSAQAQAQGQTRPDVAIGGERSIIGALRFIMP